MSLENIPEHVLDLPITFLRWEHDHIAPHETPQPVPKEEIIFIAHGSEAPVDTELLPSSDTPPVT